MAGSLENRGKLRELIDKFQLNKIAARWPAKAVAQFYFY
jgi:hypothetical protein